MFKQRSKYVLEQDRPRDQVDASPESLVDIPPGLLLTSSTPGDLPARATVTAHRHEIKMMTSDWRLYDVESWLRLHSAAFQPAYPQRQVNNIYFDTLDLESLEENLAGMAERRKLRLRWYHNDWRTVTGLLEHKCKRDLCGWKIQHPLTCNKDLVKMSWPDIVKSISDEISGPLKHRFQVRCCPVLINTYQRKYYISMSSKVRVTTDFAHVCYDQRLSARPNISRPGLRQDVIIIEVKSLVEDRDELADVVSGFPLRVSKHSKYVSAMENALG